MLLVVEENPGNLKAGRDLDFDQSVDQAFLPCLINRTMPFP